MANDFTAVANQIIARALPLLRPRLAMTQLAGAHTEPWMAAISKKEYGDPETEADLLRELSPIHSIDRVIAPTIVLHGANDTNVPVVEAEQVVEELERRKIPVEFVLFPDEGHGFRKTANRIRSTLAIVRWFDTYLKPPATDS